MEACRSLSPSVRATHVTSNFLPAASDPVTLTQQTLPTTNCSNWQIALAIFASEARGPRSDYHLGAAWDSSRREE